MGGVLSRISLRIFEFFNELFIGVASGVVGIVVLTARGLTEAHYARTIFVLTLTVGCLVYTFQTDDQFEPSVEKVVFITGCDSGLGFTLAEHVSDLGFTVVAACLSTNSKGAKELKRNKKIILVELDITSESDVNTVVETITRYLEARQFVLWALINNAGCMVFGEFEWQTTALIHQQINVNLLGTMQLTKAFCPLLRKYNARLIVISSHCALSTLPGLAVYGATKAALKAWCDGIRVELGKYGVSVISFIPGSFIQHSNIMAKHDENVLQMQTEFTSEQKKFYGDYFKRYNSYLGALSRQNPPIRIPDRGLYESFGKALLDTRPKAMYINEGLTYKIYHTIFKYAPTTVRDICIVRFMQMPQYSTSVNMLA